MYILTVKKKSWFHLRCMRTVRLPIPHGTLSRTDCDSRTLRGNLDYYLLSVREDVISIEENQRPFSAYSAAAPITRLHIQIDATRMRAKYGHKATRTLDCHIEQIKSSQLVSSTRRTDSVTPKVLQVATAPLKRARPVVQICIQECQKSIIARLEQVGGMSKMKLLLCGDWVIIEAKRKK
jgi:hypothetical protein